MSRKIVDHKGERYGHLTVKRCIRNESGKGILWLCRCDCGATVELPPAYLKWKTSCGGNCKYNTSVIRYKPGMRFGRLTLVRPVEKYGKSRGGWLWECRCDCGNTVYQHPTDLKEGHIVSCGCYRKELQQKRVREMHERNKIKLRYGNKMYTLEELSEMSGISIRTMYNWRYAEQDVIEKLVEREGTEGMITENRLREIWRSMRKRCENPNCKDYKHYGAHGIRVCKEWKTYETFKEWSLAHGYDDSKTLDRFNNNVGYSPTNCRWISRKSQAYNRTTNVFYTVNGHTRTLKEWSAIYGVPDDVILHRIKKGWDVEKAITTPKRVYKRKEGE